MISFTRAHKASSLRGVASLLLPVLLLAALIAPSTFDLFRCADGALRIECCCPETGGAPADGQAQIERSCCEIETLVLEGVLADSSELHSRNLLHAVAAAAVLRVVLPQEEPLLIQRAPARIAPRYGPPIFIQHGALLI